MIAWGQLNGADWVIIVVLVVSTALSLWRGFVREAISLAGWIAAFVIAHLFVDQLAALLGQWIASVAGRYVAGYAILFVATLVLFGLTARLARQLVKVSGLSLLDRILGTVFGFARGVILVLVVVYVVQQLARPEDLGWLRQSQLMPHLNLLANWAQELFAGVAVQPPHSASI